MKEFDIGQVVHDMHDGYPTSQKWEEIFHGYRVNTRDVSYVTLSTPIANQMVQQLIGNKLYVNKHLVYVGMSPSGLYYVFACSYDGNKFSMMMVDCYPY